MKENRIEDKIEEIEKYLEEFLEINSLTFEEYLNDFKIRAACERYFEKIIEAVVDLAFIFIKWKDLQYPEDDKNTFEILFNEKIISENLSKKLIEAKGMRNILAHEYGKTDDELVFHSITEELEPSAGIFIR